jgi:hypothetical protein
MDTHLRKFLMVTSNKNLVQSRNECNDSQDGNRKPLSPEHRNQLEASGISEEVIRERGYYTETVKADLGRLGYARSQQQTPSLVIPIKNLDGEICQHQIRPSQPRSKYGKIVKYEFPANSHLVIDVPTRARDGVLDLKIPLIITEGVKKADAAVSSSMCCVSILGVHGWKHQDEFWNRIPLEGRKVYVAFDSDVQTNQQVRQAAAGLCAFLEERKSEVHFIILPEEKGAKVGLDDYLAADNNVDDLLKLAARELPQLESPSAKGRGTQFEVTSEGLFEIRGSGRKATRIQLTNFPARISEEISFDHEGTITTEFIVEAEVAGATRSGTVPADDFDRMTWVVNLFGGEAVVFPGYGARDSARAAIQITSSPIPSHRGVQKTGWITDNGENVFVHAGGVIRAENQGRTHSQQQKRSNVTPDDKRTSVSGGPKTPIPVEDSHSDGLYVRLPDSLGRYVLPDSREDQNLTDDISKSLNLLFLCELKITIPCIAAICRVILDEVDFAIHLFGGSGNGKTELAALLSQFFGPGLDARHLPASWGSTALFLVSLTAAAKNVILVIDDLVHTGSQHDIQQVNRNAETVFRALGNRAGRGRAARDGSPREAAPPECLVVSTGEVRPSGKSLNARVLNIEINPGDILGDSDHKQSNQLAHAQADAREGAFARTTTAFIQWTAPQLDDRRRQLHELANTNRQSFWKSCRHARLANTAGELLASFEIFLEFA